MNYASNRGGRQPFTAAPEGRNYRFRMVMIWREGSYIALTMFSVIFLASPSSIIVLSR